jgi:hypothetical protein
MQITKEMGTDEDFAKPVLRSEQRDAKSTKVSFDLFGRFRVNGISVRADDCLKYTPILGNDHSSCSNNGCTGSNGGCTNRCR